MDCKRWWLTWWITKVLVIALNFFPAFISNSKYAMHLGIWRCTHHQTQVHFLRRLFLPQRNFAPLSRVAKWEAHFMRVCVCAFWHYYVLKLVIIFRSTEAAIIPKYIIALNYQHKHCQQGLRMSNPCTDKSCSTAGDRTLEAVSIKRLEQHVNQQFHIYCGKWSSLWHAYQILLVRTISKFGTQTDGHYTQSKSVTWASAFNVATKAESAGFTVWLLSTLKRGLNQGSILTKYVCTYVVGHAQKCMQSVVTYHR